MGKYFGINLNTNSLLKCAMDEAITNKVFVTTNYNSISDKDQKNRILMQEYFYWLVTTGWNIQATYGPNEAEWPYHTLSALSACDKNPKGVDLYNNVISKIMSKPSDSTI